MEWTLDPWSPCPRQDSEVLSAKLEPLFWSALCKQKLLIDSIVITSLFYGSYMRFLPVSYFFTPTYVTHRWQGMITQIKVQKHRNMQVQTFSQHSAEIRLAAPHTDSISDYLFPKCLVQSWPEVLKIFNPLEFTLTWSSARFQHKCWKAYWHEVPGILYVRYTVMVNYCAFFKTWN